MAAGLYLIYFNTLATYKLGMSANVNRRLHEHKSLHLPFVLVAAYMTPNYLRAKEALFHEVFAEKRCSFHAKGLKRECFELNEDDVKLCRAIMKRGVTLVFSGFSAKIKKLRKQQAVSLRTKLLKAQQ